MSFLRKTVHVGFAGLMLALGGLLLATGAFAQFIQTTGLGGAGGGFAIAEKTALADQWGGVTGTAVDPLDPNAIYTYDGISIRRNRIGAAGNGDLVHTFPTLPMGAIRNFQEGPYGSVLYFNPQNTHELWFAESSERHLYVITLANGSRTVVQSVRVAYTSPTASNIYDIAFDTSTATLRVIASEGNFAVSSFIHITPGPGNFTANPVGSVTGYSGPVTFDSLGNLYYAIPPDSGAPALASNQAKIIRWSAATVGAALGVGGTPLTEANADATAERLITFDLPPGGGAFPTLPSIVTRLEGGRPIVYASRDYPENVPDPSVTAAIMRIDIEQSAASDEPFWARIQDSAVAGKLAATNRTADFSPNAGQWDEGLSQPNGRIYAALTRWDFVGTTTGSVAMIVPNSLDTEIATIGVVSHPSTEYVNTPMQPVLELRDGGGNVISTGTALSTPVTVSILTGPAGGALTGTTSGTVNAGRVEFGAGYGLNTTGNYTLVFTAGGVNVQHALTIYRIASVGLIEVPSSVVFNSAFTARVELLDDSGTRITGGAGSSANVILSLVSGPDGAALNETVAAVNGVAMFNGLTLDRIGSYVIRFDAYIGAVSQANASVALEVRPQLLLSSGGSSCTAGVGGHGGPLPVVLALLAAGAILLLLRRRSVRRAG